MDTIYDEDIETEFSQEALAGRKKLLKTDEVKTTRVGRGDWMEQQRKNLQAYEYLCHVGEAKEWFEYILNEELTNISSFEDSLRNGIVLAKVAKHFEPTCVKKIFEGEVLQFRHSDNIVYFLSALRKAGLPEIFYFEFVDLYEKKNLPRVIYCIHAFSHLLTKQGRARSITNLVGALDFSEDELQRKQDQLDEAGIAIPSFGELGDALDKHLSSEQQYLELLKGDEGIVVMVQSRVRSFLAKKKFAALKSEQQERNEKVLKVQSCARGYLIRKQIEEIKQSLLNDKDWVSAVQSFSRGYIERQKLDEIKKNLGDHDSTFVQIQSCMRAFLARKLHTNHLNYFRDHLDSVIKIQAQTRTMLARRAYKMLMTMMNPPLSTIQAFSHLLSDGSSDFDEELELEKLRAEIVSKIRDNHESESLVNDLDIKIALLVKNSISIEEVMRAAKKKGRKNEASEKKFSLKALDKEHRDKLQCYQHLFYLLQTQPRYLTSLLFYIGPNKIKHFMENVVLALFAYAQNTREEYLLLKLVEHTMQAEIEKMPDVQSILREDMIFIKLIVQYNRGAKERQYLRDLLSPLVSTVISDSDLDLETDPLVIYRAMIKEEESKTGEKSALPFDAPRDEALENENVRAIYINRLKNLQAVTTQFLTAIIASLKNMPFGLRFMAKSFRKILESKFPEEDKNEISGAIGNLVYYRYMNPAIVAPEAFDVLESVISQKERKNLAEVSKMLQHIAMDKKFEDEFTYLLPLNDFVSSAHEAFVKYFLEVTNVADAEDYFEMDAYKDLIETQTPVIYISPVEIATTHSMLNKFLDEIAPDQEDELRVILSEIGEPFQVAENTDGANAEISLTLKKKFVSGLVDDEKKINSLLLQTKRLILSLISVEKGKTLLDVVDSPTSEHSEQLYSQYLLGGHGKINQSVSSLNNPSESVVYEDVTPPSLAVLKQRVQSNLESLEEAGLCTKESNYQEILTIMAKDIRNKRLRRAQRTKEISKHRQTLVNLEEKAKYLSEQIESYNDYLTSSVSQLSKSKQAKKKTVLPFTKQYSHMKELQKSGKVPKFGSFKWKAEALYKKGVLLSIEDYSPKQYDKITLTISSDEPGIFLVEASLLGIKMPQKVTVSLEDLLQCQFNNVQVYNLQGIAKLNVNLMIYLINKKFYQ